MACNGGGIVAERFFRRTEGSRVDIGSGSEKLLPEIPFGFAQGRLSPG
jgi:hypothetical protein